MAEAFTTQITVDKTIVSLLSKFTYERSFPYALREVVSNSYDADATEVRIEVSLEKDRVTIHDNGTGMTRDEFDFYLRIAGQRRGKRETPKFGRKRIGQFGVGFLAILPFCESLQITSTTENSEELLTADIPAWKFFREGGKAIDVGEIDVNGEITRSAKIKAQHFTQITLVRLSGIAKRYFKQRPVNDRDKRDRVSNWPPIDRLRWEMQEDLPLSFPEGSKLNEILRYPEPIGMDVYFQGARLHRHDVDGEVLESDDVTVEGVRFQYAIVTPWKSVKPFELRGLKTRLNNVGIGQRQVFDTEGPRSRMHWLSGECQILSGLDGAITLSRDAFVATPEYEALSEKLGSILRKWANYVETVDVAARDMTKQVRGGKHVAVAAKRDVVDRNIQALADRGFSVRRVPKKASSEAQPVHVDRSKREVVIYEEHPGLEDVITIGGKKRRILYVNSSARISHESACRLNENGEIEIETQYPLFRSKRYGDIFKKIYIIAVLAKAECASPDEMYRFVLSQIDKEFRNF